MAKKTRNSQESPAAQRSARLSDPEQRLLAAIDHRESRSSGNDWLEKERRRALEYYFGEKFGDEDPDRSQIVMRDVYATIEWIKPMLMKVFFGAKQVVKFTPTSAADVQPAAQETDYVNHIITGLNNGFETFMTWFNDALLMTNGYVFAYWDERVDVTESVYRGVDEMTLTALGEDTDIEVLEAEDTGIDPDTGDAVFTVRLRERSFKGQVKIQALPPEAVKVDERHATISLRESRFVRFRERVTISDLREQGFDVPDDIVSDDLDLRDSTIAAVRNRYRYVSDRDEDDPDPASREVYADTVFIRFDYDGDGIAELRRVLKVGRTILINEVEPDVLIASITPTPVGHRHIGLSIANAVMDIQEIKTMLTRGYIDNIFLANNGRYFIDDDRVNMDDMLVSRPGGVVRVRGGVSNAMQPFQHPVLGGAVIQAIEYMDNVLENRTGASPRVLQGQSFDGNAINKTATGINQIMSSVMSRIELIARIFAETGVQDLYRIVHGLTMRHSRKKQIFDLRGKYVEVDPMTWEKRNDMTIDAGLGIGNIQEQITALQTLVQAQMSMMAMGITNPQLIYNSMVKMTELLGFKDVESFWSPPDPQNTPPNPEAQKVQLEQQKVQMQAQAEQTKLSLEAQDRKVRAQIEMRKLSLAEQEARMRNDLESSKSYTDQMVKLTLATMASDDAKITAGIPIEPDAPALPAPKQTGEPSPEVALLLRKVADLENKPKRITYEYDNAGRIVAANAE